uniref:Uncharacterized protein n=1 Tax=viral metagenome TaxID=1070528 RepID=A0A2V0R9X7_9ZZZZ
MANKDDQPNYWLWGGAAAVLAAVAWAFTRRKRDDGPKSQDEIADFPDSLPNTPLDFNIKSVRLVSLSGTKAKIEVSYVFNAGYRLAMDAGTPVATAEGLTEDCWSFVWDAHLVEQSATIRYAADPAQRRSGRNDNDLSLQGSTQKVQFEVPLGNKWREWCTSGWRPVGLELVVKNAQGRNIGTAYACAGSECNADWAQCFGWGDKNVQRFQNVC